MRGAAAALAGALLFFLGVLTAASDTGRVPPPAAIPLGAEPAATDEAGHPAPAVGETPSPSTPAAGDPSRSASTTPGPSLPSVPPAGEEPQGSGSGGVEEVVGQVDCFDVGTGPSGACPPGQAKKVGEPPREKGGGDGKH